MQITFKHQHAKVIVTVEEVRAFMDKWPASGLREVEHEFLFDSKCDLVGMLPDAQDYDGEALRVLSEDAAIAVMEAADTERMQAQVEGRKAFD